MNPRFFCWYGGKYRMVNILQNLIPPHRIYLEPFLGSGALLINHPKSQIEIANDLDRDIANLFRTMADREKGKELVDRLCSLPYDRNLFNEILYEQKAGFCGFSDLDRAVLTYMMISQSFNATRKSFSNKGYLNGDAYRKNIRLNVTKIYERMDGVQVFNVDALGLLDYYSNCPDVFAFLDPPYRAVLRGKNADKVYKCELPEQQQVQLLRLLQNIRCKVLLCGYKDESGIDLYDTYLLPHGWHCYLLVEIVKASQNKKGEKKDKGREFIWCNYELPLQAKEYISMKEYNSLKI